MLSGTNATYNGDDSCLSDMFNCNLQFVTNFYDLKVNRLFNFINVMTGY